MHIGVDFGSKLAGTTVICFMENEQIRFVSSVKKQDADVFLNTFIQENKIHSIFIDAPLSLPSIYASGKGSDYFFRLCDRQLHAMSPMFLGGLTARAIKHRHHWESQKINVFEIYPAQLKNFI